MAEVVIKIPDEVLESRHYCQYFGVWSTKLTETIENGTVLPKGHGRLIDADTLALPSEEIVSRLIIKYAETIVEADKE